MRRCFGAMDIVNELFDPRLNEQTYFSSDLWKRQKVKRSYFGRVSQTAALQLWPV